jgi:predicted anti-sigma-YlaC factor YlaD
MNKSLLNRCLKAEEVERLVLEREFEKTDLFTSHLNNCRKCRRLFFETKMFYQILSAELNKPISARIVNLVRGLENDKVLE